MTKKLAVLLCAAALPASAMLPPGKKSSKKPFHAFKTKADHAKKRPSDEFTRGMEDIDRGQYDAAIAGLTKAVEKRPDSARYFMLGYAYYQRGFQKGSPETADKNDAVQVVEKYKSAISLDPKLTELQKPSQLYHGLGMAYEALGLNERALAAYRQAFMMDQANPALPIYGARLRMKMGATKKAMANLEAALKLAAQSGQMAAVNDFMRSNKMFAGMRQDPANAELIAKYESAKPAPAIPQDLVAMEPAMANDGYGMRDSVRGTGPSKALPPPTAEDQDVLRAIAAGNDEFKFGRWARAVDRYQWALSVSEHSRTLGTGEVAFVNERVGTACNKLGRTTEAVIALQKSIQVMPYNSSAHYQLALAYTIAGHYAEGMKYLRESLRTSPSPSELRKRVLLAKTDAELEPLRDLPAFKDALKEYASGSGR